MNSISKNKTGMSVPAPNQKDTPGSHMYSLTWRCVYLAPIIMGTVAILFAVYVVLTTQKSGYSTYGLFVFLLFLVIDQMYRSYKIGQKLASKIIIHGELMQFCLFFGECVEQPVFDIDSVEYKKLDFSYRSELNKHILNIHFKDGQTVKINFGRITDNATFMDYLKRAGVLSESLDRTLSAIVADPRSA